MLPRFMLFTLMSGCGLLIDISLALILRHSFGLPLAAAASLSFITVALINYFVCEYWLFRSDVSAASIARLSMVLFSSLAALVVRIALVSVGTVIVSSYGSWQIDALKLLTAAGASLLVNFVALQRTTFRGR